MNTNGGGLSYCHPGMYGIFLLIEAARQIRGECGERQIEGCEVALAHGNGGVLSSQATVISRLASDGVRARYSSLPRNRGEAQGGVDSWEMNSKRRIPIFGSHS